MDHPLKAVEFLARTAPAFAKAKSERVYLEEFRKSQKAMLSAQSGLRTASEREDYAYSHPDYLAVLDGLKAAVEAEETMRWQMVAAQAKIEIWRTESANHRAVDRGAM